MTRFERWLEKTAARTRPSQSGLELDVLDAVRRAGLPEPERQHPLTLRNGEVIHVDLAWPRARLGVEPGHSWWHGGDLGQRSDQARDRACDEIGWRIVRHDESLRVSWRPSACSCGSSTTSACARSARPDPVPDRSPPFRGHSWP